MIIPSLIFLLSFGIAAQADQLTASISDINQLVAVRGQILADMKSRQSKIVFLGEDHRDMTIKTFYQSVILETARTTNKRVCYFLELNRDYQSVVKGLNSNDPTSFACFEERHSTLQGKFAKLLGKMPKHFLNLAQLSMIKDAGVQLIAIDQDPSYEEFEKLLKKPNFDAETEEILVRRRNLIFANEIKAAFAKQECDIGFFSVGIGHIVPQQFPGHPRFPGIQELIPQMKPLTIDGKSCKPSDPCDSHGGTDLFVKLKP